MRTRALLIGGWLIWAAAGCRDAAPVSATPLTIEFTSGPWSGGSSGGTELLSTHYRILTTAKGPEILNHLPGFMEAAYDNYLGVTGLPPRAQAERMLIYMMGTRQEWAALTRSVVGPQWDTYSAIQAGGYCYKGICVFWDTGGVAALSVASHEGLHQFLAHRLKQHLPMWFEEGLATLAEGYQIHGQAVRFTPQQNHSRFSDLRKAIVNDWWVPLERLLEMDGGDAVKLWPPGRGVGYYGQVWALGHFLRSDPAYAARRAQFLADAEAGLLHRALKLSPAALERLRLQGRTYNRTVSVPLFKHYITDDLAGFEKRYKAHARKLARL
ncbi:MAG: hypothetical protein WBF17_06060 [Phycisphaerae bacterium]